MYDKKPLFDELARAAHGAKGALAGLRDEAETILHHQIERVIGALDLVHREELDVVRAMAVKAREEQESLAARLAALEAKVGTGE